MAATLTTVTTSTGGISAVYDYSSYLERIASSLESIAVSAKKIETLSTTTGIRSYSAYDWIKPLEMISWYGQEYGISSYSTTGTQKLVSIINSLTNQVSKFE
jgi:hypothetical protein